ncbi:class V chitinase-like [Papaver somniferum]|uniref:class V chitinase-like n=1 Tax=Papaver somniferum TaxID=3469 RepID=UPI000E705EB8|nr:class V chitinase-like [Papaver somniferum]
MSSSSNGIIGGFWPSWYASSRPPSSIPTSHYTHLFYAFVNPDPNAFFTLKITSEDKGLMSDFTNRLHSNNSSVKAFLAIGGATDEEAKNQAFSAMACKPKNREYFIQSVIEVARKYGFDGVNLGWEFPYGETGMKYLASLLAELRGTVDQEARQTGKTKLGISLSVFFAPDLSLMSSKCTLYPATAIASNVDFVNLMCYDYAGYWDIYHTGSIAGLYSNSGPYSTSYGIHKWIEAGVPPEKLVMGLPVYGRTWKLKDKNNNGIGAPAVGTGPEDSKYDKGYMLYHNVVTFNDTRNATEVYDEETVSCYSYSGTNWISYDGVKSIEAKVKYAKDHHLGGYFFWAVGQDSRNSLFTAAWNAWRN